MEFKDIELGSYLVAPNKSFLYYVFEKDYQKKTCIMEVLDVKRPLLKFSDNFRIQLFHDFRMFQCQKEYQIECSKKLIKIIEKMNREKLEGKILEILSEYNTENTHVESDDAEKLSQLIMNLIPKTSLEQVEEFMITAKQPTTNSIGDIDEQRRWFRIGLIQEELQEFIDAKTSEQRADALGDMQYVLDGLVIEEGFKNSIHSIICEIHRSNMSKFDKTIEEATRTYEKYQEQKIETFSEAVGENIVTYRSSDNKVLKSCNYSEPNLKPYL